MNNGTVIILNGTSSSGKTSIVHALQNLMDEPFLEAGIDKFIWMLPDRYLERPLWDDVLGLAVSAGSAGRQLFSGMHQAGAALSKTGNNVILDHVLVEPAWLQEICKIFIDLPTYLVGVRCPLEILEERERQRKNRTFGQAKAQYELVHTQCIYDLEVDTSMMSPEECALQIKYRLNELRPPEAIRQLNKKFIEDQT